MKKLAVVLGILVLVVSIIYVGTGFKPASSVPIMGYDGITSEFVDIEHGYTDASESISITSASMRPKTVLDNGMISNLLTPTGLRAELGQPSVIGSRLDWSDMIIVEDETTSTRKTWEAHIIQAQMGVTIRTDGIGVATVNNVIFWIQLEENSYSVFTDATESIAFIIEVYTYDEATESNIDLIDVDPASGSYTIPPTTVETEPIPPWIAESGYTGNLQNFKKIKFPLKVLEATPGHILGWARTETQVTFHLQIDILLFGYWEVVSEFKKWIEPDIPDLIADLLAFIIQFLGLIIGLVCTIVILWKVPDYRIKAVGIIVVWAIVGWQLGWLDMLLAGLT